MKPVRVLHIGMTPNYGGLESFVMNIYRNIDRNKIQFDFMTLNDSKIAYEDEILSLGGNVYPILYRRRDVIKHFTHLPFKFFQKHREIQIVHFHKSHLADLDVLIVSKIMGVPIRIIHAHSSGYIKPLGKIAQITEKINKRYLKKLSTHNLSCSNYAGKWMFGDLPFKIIPNAIDTDKFRFNADKRDEIRNKLNLKNKFVIGHVGTFFDVKNQSFLIDVFQNFYFRNKNSVLILIGDGPLKKDMMEKVKSLGLQDHVIFTGIKKNINDYLQAMDVFTLPSKFEGLPIVAIEAQTSGLPCILSKNITDEVKLTNQVYFESIDNIDGWVSKLEHIKNEVKVMGKIRLDNVNQIRKAGYDIKTMAKQIEQFYLSVLADK